MAGDGKKEAGCLLCTDSLPGGDPLPFSLIATRRQEKKERIGGEL